MNKTKPKFIYVKPKKSAIKTIVKEMGPALSSLADK